ncbi:helix-turn-helix transcriptional regulator [Ancylomarina sp. 16SWW S1-10-2]|uniref:AraC family transcriptional regulator n=1 Tax=Ancylomarina sp. 16SWW S1-10-2 TaxID=2499681 RepID=UPI0012AD42E9|nr:helix-turn-helix transcriptional regulator [Ancylomarina sp. 16SWW S1-10-2]MRT92608.1 helix-turn-helix domain-containing protein [Ancylomarina sp. 16SWW S1-10-2]
MKHIPEISFWKYKELQIKGFQFYTLEKLITVDLNPSDHSPYLPHRLNFYAILIITDGEVNHIIDFKVHTLRKGDVMVISKGQIHAFEEGVDYKGYLVVFSESFMQKYIAQATIARINHLYNYFLKQEKINNPDYNQTLFNTLKRELKSDSSSLPNIVASLLTVYLLKLNDENIRLATTSVDNKYMDYFQQFKLLVEQNYSKTRDAKSYASDIAISYKHLNEVCKKIVQTTAKTFIDNYVVLEAKRMLVSTSLSVKEIAFTLGFDEPTNFLKYFKKHTSLTPVEFRNALA